jgi:hypothetical protein
LSPSKNSRDGVAQLAHAEKAALDDAVEQLLDQLVAADALRVIFRLEADALQCLLDHRAEAIAQLLLAALDGRQHQMHKP